jgi:hypothetical protein
LSVLFFVIVEVDVALLLGYPDVLEVVGQLAAVHHDDGEVEGKEYLEKEVNVVISIFAKFLRINILKSYKYLKV